MVANGDNVVYGLTCNASVAVGDWVRMSGSTVVQAQADSATNANVIGLVIAKSGATTADVQTVGVTTSIFVGLTVNVNYFLSPITPGAMTTTEPSGAGEVYYILGRSLNGTQFNISLSTAIVRA
jgi:hypothetical protein